MFNFFKYYKAGKRLLKDRNYKAGKAMLEDPCYREWQQWSRDEGLKEPKRTEVLNFLLAQSTGRTCYLEIGVKNPDRNYNHIDADQKYSVDPGLEFEANPVDFKMASDDFFESLSQGEILSTDVRFDVIFIDGLHLADQVDRDIRNSLKWIKDDGFVVLHDCNPPTEWHAREDYSYYHTPAHGYWNGTTWKAFLKWRSEESLNSCCIDSDWGIGILSKTQPIGAARPPENTFYEFAKFSQKREESLNLISFEAFKSMFNDRG